MDEAITTGPGGSIRTGFGDASTPSITLTVPGKPQQWARASRGGAGHSFTPSHVVQQMDRLHLAWERSGKWRFPDETPLLLHAGFFFERPKSHYRTGKFSGILKDGYEDLEPIGRPDFDNLLKLIGDTLSGQAFDDDSRITIGGWILGYLPRGTGAFTKVKFQPSNPTWRRLILGELDVDLTEGQA